MYIRDKRSPTPMSEAVSRVMSANRAKNSSPELLLRKALWSNGLRGYRLHLKIRLTRETRPTRPTRSTIRNQWVRPDISYVGKKLAIFVHGCFWHRCPKCNYKLPKTNQEFWQQKFARNVARDESKRQALEALGWTVLTVWECEISSNLGSKCSYVKRRLRGSKP